MIVMGKKKGRSRWWRQSDSICYITFSWSPSSRAVRAFSTERITSAGTCACGDDERHQGNVRDVGFTLSSGAPSGDTLLPRLSRATPQTWIRGGGKKKKKIAACFRCVRGVWRGQLPRVWLVKSRAVTGEGLWGHACNACASLSLSLSLSHSPG